MEEQHKITVTECNHYWLIEAPNGPTSYGVCKHCGERSEFKNSVQGSGWDRDGSQRRAKQQARDQ